MFNNPCKYTAYCSYSKLGQTNDLLKQYLNLLKWFIFPKLDITNYTLQFHQNESWLAFPSHFLVCNESDRNMSKSFCTFSIKIGY